MAEGNSEMMEAIGGYFELADREYADNFLHKEGILLNTGRNALEYILRSIKRVSCIYLPYYTCEVVLEPIKRLCIPYRYYHINSQFEIADRIHLEDNEYIIVNNYFGIKDQYIRSIYSVYGDRMIVDCAQALFQPVIKGIKAFYSVRKFVGVADGGIAYLGNELGEDINSYSTEPTDKHSDHLYIRKEKGAEAGFKNYQVNEKALENQPIRLMSSITKDALLHIDYKKVKAQRIKNWMVFDKILSGSNQLSMFLDFECPMVYPYVIDRGAELRQKLISERIFVACYWQNVVMCKGFEFEAGLVEEVVALPIDQRYVEKDMERIISIIRKFKFRK